MQKVEGSSPFIRFREPAGNGGFFIALALDLDVVGGARLGLG